MENNMNFEENTTLRIVILVFLALALLTTSSVAAQPITVDGNGSDWDPSWFLFSDSINDTDPTNGSAYHYFENGYDLTGVWQHYNATEDTLYIRYDTNGIAGDSDNNGNPTNCTYLDHDRPGLGIGEVYVVRINTSSTGKPDFYPDLIITYGYGDQILLDGWVQSYTNVTAAFCNETPFSHVVEFSMDNVTGWVDNPYKYSIVGWASSATDGISEDHLDETIYVTFPPVANFTFVAGDCNQTVWFDPSGSYDDSYGGIVNYTWDFDDDLPVEVKYDNTSFTHLFPNSSRGAYNVSLTVIDTDNLTDTLVREVLVNRGPDMINVTVSKTSVAEPGEWVLFEGWYSDPDGDTLTHRWFIDGIEIANGSSTTYSNVSYFVNRSITANLTITDPQGCINRSSVSVTYLHLPVPVINFTAAGCLRVELNASGSYDPDGDITDYLWVAENGTIYNNTNVTCTANFIVGGNYTIWLNVTDNHGLTNTTTQEICVSCVPTAVAEVNRTNVTEPGGWVLFDGSNSTCDTTCDTGNSLSHIWNITDDSGSTIDHNASVLRNVTSNTTAVLTVTDEYDCTNSSSVNVTYLHLPVPVINFTATGCLRVELNASNSSDHDGYIKKYEWDLNNNSVYGDVDDTTGVNCTVSFSDGGNHTIGLRVTDNSNLTNSTRQVICVSCVPTAVARANRTNVTEPGGWVLFDGSNSTCDTTCDTGNSLSYSWNITDDSESIIDHNASVLRNVTSNTTAVLTVTDEYDCTNSSSVNVTYRHRPVPVINFTATGCLEVELNASGSYDPDGNITDYLWDAENGSIDNNTNVTCTANFSVGGNHTIRLNVTDNDGLTNTTTREIYVSRKPTAVAEASQTNVTEPGGWVLFNGSNSTCDMTVNNSLSYSWNISDDSGYIIDHNVSVLYPVTSNTTAFLNVTDAYGCTNRSSVNVTYRHRPIPVINFTATGCLEVELNASESYDLDGRITNYTWVWDPNNDGKYDNGTGVTCTANFSVGENHTIRLNVTDNDGLTNATTREIYVSCVPTAAARANRTTVTTPGGMVLFDAPNSTCDTNANVNNSLNYTWTIHGTPRYDSSGEGIEYFVTNTTTAFLIVTDEYKCTAADNVTVTCQHPPVAEFDFNGTGCKECILNASDSYDPDGNITTYEWDLNDDGVYDNGTGVTCAFGPVPVPPEDYWIGLKVTDDAGASNITRKQISLTGDPDAVAKANGYNVSIQLPAGGGWVVFDGTGSTAYLGTGIVNASCTWDIPGNGTYPGLGPLPPIFIDRDTTATLTVVANNTCTDVSSVRVRMPLTEEDVPILAPAGMVVLIGILCIAGMGRIEKKGRRS